VALQAGAPMLIHLKLDADVSTTRGTLTATREAARLAGR
jgi:acetolactate synthase-1/2/3 large subunit